MAAHPARRVLSAMPVRALVDLLDRTKHHFTPAATAAKRAALADLAGRPIRDAGVHEALAFLRAYPDSPEILEAARGRLKTIASPIRALLASGRGRALEGVGLAGTAVRCPLSYPAARWLARRFPDTTDIDWDDADAVHGLDVLLPFLAGLAEEEVLVEAGVPARAWLTAIKGNAGGERPPVAPRPPGSRTGSGGPPCALRRPRAGDSLGSRGDAGLPHARRGPRATRVLPPRAAPALARPAPATARRPARAGAAARSA